VTAARALAVFVPAGFPAEDTMVEARGFDDLFNPMAAWLGIRQGPRAPARGAPASTSQMRGRTSFAYGMGDCSEQHSRQSLAASRSVRTRAPASITSQRGRTSFREEGAVVEGFGSFVDQYQPSLDPSRPAPRAAPRAALWQGPSQPAPVTKMRQFTSFEKGL
jgi:hypothetical protein